MRGVSVCEKCQKEFSWKRAASQVLPKLCSIQCRKVDKYCNPEYHWKNLSVDKKIQRLSSSFESKVIKKEGCWDWIGGEKHTNNGYLRIRFDGKKILAHRASWIINKGEINNEDLVLHTCDNRRCTNPEHLYLGNRKQNDHDRVSRNRQAKGCKNGFSKLNEEKVAEIKKMLSLSIEDSYIAKRYNVSSACIWTIKKGFTWKHV